MDDSEETIRHCRSAMNSAMVKAGLNYSTWAARAGVSESGVRGFLNGSTPNISLAFMAKLAAAAGKKVSDFLPPTLNDTDAAYLADMHSLDETGKEAVRTLVGQIAKGKKTA